MPPAGVRHDMTVIIIMTIIPPRQTSAMAGSGVPNETEETEETEKTEATCVIQVDHDLTASTPIVRDRCRHNDVDMSECFFNVTIYWVDGVGGSAVPSGSGGARIGSILAARKDRFETTKRTEAISCLGVIIEPNATRRGRSLPRG